MPNGDAWSIKIVDRRRCFDTRYKEGLQEKGAQHEPLEGAFRDCGMPGFARISSLLTLSA